MRRTFDYQRFLKWTGLLALVLFVSVLIYGVFLYMEVEQNKASGMVETEKHIYAETDLVTIDQIDRFYGAHSYHVVYGADAQEVNYLAFVPLTTPEEPIALLAESEIMSQAAVQEQWANDCLGCSFIKMTPGIVDDRFMWELTYRDQRGRYVLELLSIFDGTQYERLSLTRRFK